MLLFLLFAVNFFSSLMLSYKNILIHLMDKISIFVTIKQIIMQEFSLTNLNPQLINKIQNEFSRIFERKASLKLSGVKKRNFYNWKEEGIIDWKSENEDEKRSWVRLNIYDFIWVKIVQNARDFGIPFEAIRDLKNELFGDLVSMINDDPESFYQFHREEIGASEEDIKRINEFIEYVENSREELIEQGEIHLISILGSFIHETLFAGLHVVIIFKKVEEAYKFDLIGYSEQYDQLPKLSDDFLKQPTLIIPLDALIAEFMEEEDNLPNLVHWGFITPKEMNVLDALRKKDFQSIQVKRGKGEEFIIEGNFETDFIDEKAKELRRILGLKEYEMVTIKYRNDKHVYVKNTRRL